jgi:tripartite-type tricarboxylate transporter receptor subunit TctC
MGLKKETLVRIALRLCRAALACCLFAAAGAAAADDFPQKPIRMLLGFSAVGSTDAIARLYATKLAEILKVPVVVENRAGAGQLVAIRALMSSPADGYTLFLGSGSAMSQGPGVRKDLPYDPLKDFSMVALVGQTQGVVFTSPSLPVKTMGELVQYAKKHPGELNYGSSGVGSASHLQIEYIMNLAGITMTHIPYKADKEIITAMGEGSVQVGLGPLQGATPFIKDGRVRAMAVTGSKREAALPGVPAMSEVNVPGLADVEPYTYYALVGPKGLDPAVARKINDAVNQASRMPDLAAMLRQQLYEPGTGSPEDLRKFIERDLQKWRKLGDKIKLD